MDKKLANIQTRVDSSTEQFFTYLCENLGPEVLEILDQIGDQTDVFIFSGVIRNFFLKSQEMRDLDIVLEKPVDLHQIFKGRQIRKNSFGGYKIEVNKTKIDLWYLEDTWAIKHQKVIDNIDLREYIPYTAFFNFSSVVYSLNNKKFIYTKHFLRFLRDRNIDVVYKPNANNPLCIVNTFYYSDKYKLKISNRLKRYLKSIYKSGDTKYEDVQKKHFGNVLYSNKEIDNRLRNLVTKKEESSNMFEIQSLYNKAIDFAAKKHLGQTLFVGSDIPYLVHLNNVAMEVLIASMHTSKLDLQLAIPVALLHDSIEDTNTTFDEIRAVFGDAVADGVSALTKSKSLQGAEAIHDSLKRIKKQPKEIWAVKLADRITNLLPPPKTWTTEKKHIYQEEAITILKELKGGNRYLEKRLKIKISEYNY